MRPRRATDRHRHPRARGPASYQERNPVPAVRWTVLSKQPEETTSTAVDRTIPGDLLPLRAAAGVVVAVCLMASLVHVLFVFLHVAPSNEVSRRYSAQINAWIYPFFE